MFTDKDYVSFETAAKLNAAGFDEWVTAYYTNNYVNDDPEDITTEVILYKFESLANYNVRMGYFSAPTLAEANKWLREKNIIIDVSPVTLSTPDHDEHVVPYSWVFKVYIDYKLADMLFWTDQDEECTTIIRMFDTYEEALDAAISVIADYLIYKNKKQ